MIFQWGFFLAMRMFLSAYPYGSNVWTSKKKSLLKGNR